jgi:hypothetical protein
MRRDLSEKPFAYHCPALNDRAHGLEPGHAAATIGFRAAKLIPETFFGTSDVLERAVMNPARTGLDSNESTIAAEFSRNR